MGSVSDEACSGSKLSFEPKVSWVKAYPPPCSCLTWIVALLQVSGMPEGKRDGEEVSSGGFAEPAESRPPRAPGHTLSMAGVSQTSHPPGSVLRRSSRLASKSQGQPFTMRFCSILACTLLVLELYSQISECPCRFLHGVAPRCIAHALRTRLLHRCR